MRLIFIIALFINLPLLAAEKTILEKEEFRKQWKAIPTIEAAYAASTPDGTLLFKSKKRINAKLTFTITEQGKAENITVLSVSPDKPGYKQAFKQYYQTISFKPLVENPIAPATVFDTSYFGRSEDEPVPEEVLERVKANNIH